jgi:hypothetical protein
MTLDMILSESLDELVAVAMKKKGLMLLLPSLEEIPPLTLMIARTSFSFFGW